MTADGTIALIQVDLGGGNILDLAEPIVETVEEADESSPLRITVVGEGSVEGEIERLIEETLLQGEVFGVGVALIILLVVMGTLVSAILPILLAVTAIVLAQGSAALLGEVMQINDIVENITVMIGLAVGIDYSFFIVQRFREERAAGRDKVDALAFAGKTASRTVFFSGVAVAIALAGMFIIPVTVFQSLALGAILVVVGAVLAALTLLPAVLSLLGNRVDRFRVPFRRLRPAGQSGRFWNTVIRAVVARPVLSVVATTAALAVLGAFFFTINLGSNGINTLPEGNDFRHALEVLNDEFSDGVSSADIVIDAPDVNAPAVAEGVASLNALLDADEVFSDRERIDNPAGDLTLIRATFTVDSTSDAAAAAIERLRDDYIPASFAAGSAEVLVGGDAAEVVDAVGVANTYLPIVIAFVLALSFLLLLLVFRSIVVPLKAVVMNLLSVGAAYGLIVLVFQEGVGAGLLGFQTSPTVEFWIPLFLFSILFGLSMDYHVFMLSRIKERFDVTGDNSEAVSFGLRSTGAIITGAALIMVAVFGGFASGDLVFFQQMGFGLAVAIILDATIVRIVLVPAAMELLGGRNWYFPPWLEWLPSIEIEGHVDDPVPAPAPAGGGD